MRTMPAAYTVLAGDTVYSIAWRHDVDYRDLARWNRLGADYRIMVGQVLRLAPAGPLPAVAPRASANPPPRPPESSPRGAAPPAAALPVNPRTESSGPFNGAAAPAAANPPPDAAAVLNGSSAAHWVWPTVHAAPPQPVPSGGILLLGQEGQEIRAAATGRVVYTGSGIRGYGNLIIVKHGESLLTSYAHNRDVLVHEGQDVLDGQIIAHMGTGPHQIAALYFEIRVNGKPVDPLRYLPPAAAAPPPGDARPPAR